MSDLDKVNALGKLNRDTPGVVVYSNAGLTARHLGYYRAESKKIAAVRIQLFCYDHRGRLSGNIDPRLSEPYLKDASSVFPNQLQVNTLNGVLQIKNVDAGTRIVLSDCQGQTLWMYDSRGTERTFDYDALRRVKAIYEKEQNKETICTERVRYGEVAAEKDRNCVGRLQEQYDSSGRRVISEYSVLGQVKKETQFFLKANTLADWTENDNENNERLEEECYTSEWYSNALGETIRQIDAAGNERRIEYELSNQIKQLSLKLNQGNENILSQARTYNARGQLQEERLGNGIHMHYRYETQTQRLSEKIAKRLSDNSDLQSLRYCYDPVGNIICIENQSEAVKYFNNEKTKAISHYSYDSFYQLIESKGIESVHAEKASPQLVKAIPFDNSNMGRLVNYRRQYQYDASGNLFEIKHQGASRYTQKIRVDSHSNQGIEERESGPNLQESFDGNGNLLYINSGQPLLWDNRNQLKESIQIERDTVADREMYRYDSQGKRLEKQRSYLTKNQIHTKRVRYLPGLELREYWQTDQQGNNKKLTEMLAVIQTQIGESVKALHWEKGKPEALENDRFYYTLSDQIGSNQLELNEVGEVVSYEYYYPYGGTAVWATKSQIEADYKYKRYSGKERDHSGLYYYGYRYYMPWLGRWVNADPSGLADGLNLFQMAHNNPIRFYDSDGRAGVDTSNVEASGSSSPPDAPSRAPKMTKGTEVKNWFLQYRVKQVGRFKAPFWPAKKVDVVTSKIDLAGKKDIAYVLKGPSAPENLFVNTHGSFGSYSRGDDFEGFINLEENMPTITVFGPHGLSLSTSIEDYKTYKKIYAKVSSEGITLSSDIAEKHFRESGFSKITGSEQPRAIRNYTLSKFETKMPGFATELHTFEGMAQFIQLFQNENTPTDILTLRKKAVGITVRDVMTFAQEAGYKNVMWNFCRVSYKSGNSFEAKSVEVLPNPSFRNWSDLEA